MTSLTDSNLLQDFTVLKKNDDIQLADAEFVNSNNISPLVLLIDLKLATGSGEHVKSVSYAFNLFLWYKLLTTAKDGDNSSIGCRCITHVLWIPCVVYWLPNNILNQT